MTAQLKAVTAQADGLEEVRARLEGLRARFGHLEGRALLEAMIGDAFPGKIAVVSSFGAESAVLLHLVASIDPTVPVLFLNTGKLFGETLRYRDRLQSVLGLTDVRSLHPHPEDEKALDPKGDLWTRDPDQCCNLRKVLPLERGLRGFEAEITGRKRFQTRARAEMRPIEWFEGRFKVNPLASWTLEELSAYVEAHNLPKHPLVSDGYLSIGCMPCTARVQPGGEYRSGRWVGRDKDECGIHGNGLTDGAGI
ncbi:MAG: phosphoadenylyl-sulfate reductase [Alphaproteobacteria bacterium]|nr:phosphoadenylyl-sulfate reductase [Alphaproteobacteria bacterium]